MTAIVIPIRIESVDNLREHWSKRAKRAYEHREAVWWHLKAAKAPHALPCVVTLTRIAPRSLDGHDNLRSGLKAACDGVTDWLLAKTDADPRIEWRYAQERGRPHEYALRVEITEPVPRAL